MALLSLFSSCTQRNALTKYKDRTCMKPITSQTKKPTGLQKGNAENAFALNSEHTSCHGPTQVTAQHRSVPNTGQCPTQVTAQHRSLPNTGHCPTQVTAQHRSLPNTGHCPTQVSAQHRSVPNTGQCPTQVSAQHRSLPNTGQCPTQVSAQHRSLPNTGQCPTQVTAQHRSVPNTDYHNWILLLTRYGSIEKNPDPLFHQPKWNGGGTCN